MSSPFDWSGVSREELARRLWLGRRGAILFVLLLLLGGGFLWHARMGQPVRRESDGLWELHRGVQHREITSTAVIGVARFMPFVMGGCILGIGASCAWFVRHANASTRGINFALPALIWVVVVVLGAVALLLVPL